MDPTVVGAIVGAAAGIIGALLATWFQLRLEHFRVKQNREDAIAKEFADALQQLTIRTAASIHSMCWLTWLAGAGGERINQAHLDTYDTE